MPTPDVLICLASGFSVIQKALGGMEGEPPFFKVSFQNRAMPCLLVDISCWLCLVTKYQLDTGEIVKCGIQEGKGRECIVSITASHMTGDPCRSPRAWHPPISDAWPPYLFPHDTPIPCHHCLLPSVCPCDFMIFLPQTYISGLLNIFQ